MTNEPKILLACPVSVYKDYILYKWIDSVRTELEGNFDILLVDNSSNIQHFRKLKSMGINVIHTKPYVNEKLNETLSRCMNIILKYALDNNYSHLFSLECDIFPPADIIETLLNHNKQVVSAAYNIGTPFYRTLMLQVPFVTGEDTFDVKTVSPKEAFEAITGQLIKVYGCGLGCTLIQTEILKDYQFRTDPNLTVHSDTFFHIDLYNRGFESWLDTSVFCQHHNSSWSEILRKHARKQRF